METRAARGPRATTDTATGTRLTAAIRFDGDEATVLEQATRLLRLVEELHGATLVSLRVDYDPAMAPTDVLASGADPFLEGAAGGTASPEEAELWRLALRAAASPQALVKRD
jgi:hypothetical protein